MELLLKSPSEKSTYPKPYKISISQLQKMYETKIIDPENRLELINGEIIMMAPIGFKHMKTVNKLNEILNKIIFENKLDISVSIQNPIKVSENTLLYPDLVIFGKDIYKKEEIPKVNDAILIIEVSDTTLEYDKNVKLPIYAKNKAKEVWIVDLNKEIVEVYKNPFDDTFKEIKLFNKEEKMEILNTQIDLKELF